MNWWHRRRGRRIWRAGETRKGPGGPGLGIATRTRARTKKPTPYKVLMLNDDYTPMEFVVDVLQRFFRMDIEQATRVMLHVHQKGVGVCGVFKLRSRRDQGQPGDGLRPAEPAPAPVHAGDGIGVWRLKPASLCAAQDK